MNNNVLSLIYREKTIIELNKKIKLLGINYKYNIYKFMTLRIISSIILFIVVLFLNDLGYILAPIITYLYYSFLHSMYFNPLFRPMSLRPSSQSTSTIMDLRHASAAHLLSSFASSVALESTTIWDSGRLAFAITALLSTHMLETSPHSSTSS